MAAAPAVSPAKAAPGDNLFRVVDPDSKDFHDIAGRWDLPCPILQIRKVNNSRLWRKYQFVQSEITEQVGKGNVNETMLWHGTSGSTAEIIATEGFDHRVGVKNGRAFGDGIYFTEDAVLALRYGLGNENYKKMSRFMKSQTFALSRFVFGTPTPFVPRTDTDVTNVTNVHIRYQAISMMKEYESKSVEELRMEDYAANRRGKIIPFCTTIVDEIDLGYAQEDFVEDETSDATSSSTEGLLVTNKQTEGRFHAIELMPEYRDKSREEVRWEDYRMNRRGSRPPFVAFEEEEEPLVDSASFSSSSSSASHDGISKRKVRYHSITAMPVYANRSFEELRIEDYKLGRKGGKISSLTASSSGGRRTTGPNDVTMPSAQTPAQTPAQTLSQTPAQTPVLRSVKFKIPGPTLPPFASHHYPLAFNTPAAASSSSPSRPSPAPSPDTAYAIFARVTLGVSTPGKASYTRPPSLSDNDLSMGRYNSCTGKLDEQSVFVVFDNAQAYPEYLVQYKMDDDFSFAYS